MHSWHTSYLTIPQQSNLVDCGVFVLEVIKHFIFGHKMEFAQKDMNDARILINWEIVNQNIVELETESSMHNWLDLYKTDQNMMTPLTDKSTINKQKAEIHQENNHFNSARWWKELHNLTKKQYACTFSSIYHN